MCVGPLAPSIPKPAVPPPPAPPPEPPKVIDAAVQTARRNQRRIASAQAGYSGTIASGPLGVSGGAATSNPSLKPLLGA